MATGQKICVVCGQDCSTRKRTKDSKGNYFCTSCYERRVKEVRDGKSPSLVPPMELPPSKIEDDSPFQLDPSLIEMEAPTAVASMSNCPSCGRAVTTNAVICMSCGYNVQTGHAMHTKVKRDHSAATSATAGVLLSPMAIGLATLALMGVLFMLGMQNDAAAATFVAAYLALSLIVGIWAIVAGFMEGVGYGLGTLCVPFFVLYTVYSLNENSYLKWLYSVHLLCIPGYIVLLNNLEMLFDQRGF